MKICRRPVRGEVVCGGDGPWVTAPPHWSVSLEFFLFLFFFDFSKIYVLFFFSKMSPSRRFVRRKAVTAGWTGGRMGPLWAVVGRDIPPVETRPAPPARAARHAARPRRRPLQPRPRPPAARARSAPPATPPPAPGIILILLIIVCILELKILVFLNIVLCVEIVFSV